MEVTIETLVMVEHMPCHAINTCCPLINNHLPLWPSKTSCLWWVTLVVINCLWWYIYYYTMINYLRVTSDNPYNDDMTWSRRWLTATLCRWMVGLSRQKVCNWLWRRRHTMASSGNGRGIGSTTRHRQVDIQVDLQIASERCRPITHRLFSRSTMTALSAIQFQPSSRLWPTIWSTFDRFSNRLSNSTKRTDSLLPHSSTKMPELG